MAHTFTTVGDLIAELSKHDPDLPVIVSTHYDNDEGLKYDFDVRPAPVDVAEANFYMEIAPADVIAGIYPNAIDAVIIQ